MPPQNRAFKKGDFLTALRRWFRIADWSRIDFCVTNTYITASEIFSHYFTLMYYPLRLLVTAWRILASSCLTPHENLLYREHMWKP